MIISRASEDSAETKLKRAGCNHVIMPERAGGAAMASLVTKPCVVEFMHLLTGPGSFDTYLQEIKIKNTRTIKELEIKGQTGAIVIGVQLPEGRYIVNPNPDFSFPPDSKLIVLGNRDQISMINALIQS